MCTGKESDVSPPWPSLGPSFLRNRRGAIFTAKGSGLCLGVPWAPYFLRDKNKIMCVAARFCVPEIIHRGIMCIAKDICLGVVWAPLLLGQRHATMSTAKGSDVRPGVPRAPALCAFFAWVGHTPWCALGPHLFCNAGVGQYALPRDRMYAVASLGLHVFCVASAGQFLLCQGVGYMHWRDSGSASFAWQA